MLDGRLPGTGVDRGEDSPVHGHEVGSEDDFNRFASPAGHGRQHLADLGGLPVQADVVGSEALVALGEMVFQLGRPARDRDAALGVDDDRGPLDQILGDQGSECQDAGRRVTARVAMSGAGRIWSRSNSGGP